MSRYYQIGFYQTKKGWFFKLTNNNLLCKKNQTIGLLPLIKLIIMKSFMKLVIF